MKGYYFTSGGFSKLPYVQRFFDNIHVFPMLSTIFYTKIKIPSSQYQHLLSSSATQLDHQPALQDGIKKDFFYSKGTLILENKKYDGWGPVLKFLILSWNLSTDISYAFLILLYFSTHFLVLSYQII